MACYSTEDSEIGDIRVDELESLVFVAGGRGGYRPDLLLAKMTNVEAEMLVCNCCNGITWEACITDELHKTGCRDCLKISGLNARPWEKGRKLVEGLACKCPLDMRGCAWTGHLRDLGGHWDECFKRRKECTLNCKQIIAQDCIAAHVQRYCPNRAVTCQYCGKIVQARIISNHEANVCMEIPTPCPKGCGYQVPKKSVSAHIQTECNCVGIPCVFREIGCDVSVNRGDMQEHLLEDCPQHLTQLMLEFKKMTGKYEEAMRRIEGLEREKTIMKKQMADRRGIYEKITSDESDDAMN
ncbi:TNF receptor-associated factor 4 [Oopsacas minuta]|uniref:TNF receptor-associated factor 4 n=1 Tax=Oopsacas minuta TaxID=111878 RepID=A0AAV7JGI0_9METZ|nr:TNF receptor-associated factor 4 [Oopsacas minuta]